MFKVSRKIFSDVLDQNCELNLSEYLVRFLVRFFLKGFTVVFQKHQFWHDKNPPTDLVRNSCPNRLKKVLGVVQVHLQTSSVLLFWFFFSFFQFFHFPENFHFLCFFGLWVDFYWRLWSLFGRKKSKIFFAQNLRKWGQRSQETSSDLKFHKVFLLWHFLTPAVGKVPKQGTFRCFCPLPTSVVKECQSKRTLWKLRSERGRRGRWGGTTQYIPDHSYS